MKAGKFGDSFYVRTHLAYSKAQTLQRGQQQQQTGQQPAELSFQPGDIFHVTDTLFGGSPGYWQVTKVRAFNISHLCHFHSQVYSAVDAEQKPSAGTGQGPEPNAGIIPHAKMAEQLMAQQRQAERANNGINGNSEQSGGGGTLSRSLFRKKVRKTKFAAQERIGPFSCRSPRANSLAVAGTNSNRRKPRRRCSVRAVEAEIMRLNWYHRPMNGLP